MPETTVVGIIDVDCPVCTRSVDVILRYRMFWVRCRKCGYLVELDVFGNLTDTLWGTHGYRY